MVFQLPPFNDMVNNEMNRKKKYIHSTVQYEPVYNTIYDTKMKEYDTLRTNIKEDVSIFDMTLFTIFQNIANSLLIIIIDLLNIDNYTDTKTFLSIFIKQNRLIYFGIFLTLVSIYIILFFS
jgi:hypothetical protein